jgi:hypothetical protein
MNDKYSARIFIPDDAPQAQRAYAEQSIKHQILGALVDEMWESAEPYTHPYCIEIVQKWENVPGFKYMSMYDQDYPGPGQYLTLTLHIHHVGVTDYIFAPQEIAYEWTPSPRKTVRERISRAIKYIVRGM